VAGDFRLGDDLSAYQCCHAGALLTEKQTECYRESVSIRRLKELAFPESLPRLELHRDPDFDLFELGAHLGSCRLARLVRGCFAY